MEVVGVDFSGAKSDKNTWMARAIYEETKLFIQECRRVGRAELAMVLCDLKAPSVAALDFPFSVPFGFARYWQPSAQAMPELWKAACEIEFADFMRLRDDFVALHGELKRVCDAHFPESFSCLHKTNPNMVPMTFRGMQMLHGLWGVGCDVPPLDSQNEGKAVLLEAMPGAALRAFGLPYKGYKNGSNAIELRERIIAGLSQRSGVQVVNIDSVKDICIASHDCLDAIVAALVAALWARDSAMFRLPSEGEMRFHRPQIELEGWLYAPVFVNAS